MSLRQPDNGGKPAVPPRTHLAPPPTVTLTVVTDGPVHHFARLEAAVTGRDYRTATTLRRQLYRAGWSIVPPRSPFWQRGRP